MKLTPVANFIKLFFNIIFTVYKLASENTAWYNHSAYFVTVVTYSYKLQVTTEIANSAIVLRS
jgi:hypothetical protein